MATKKEEVPIILQDGTVVEEGKRYFRVRVKDIKSARYYTRKEVTKRDIRSKSGSLTTEINEDTCIRIQVGFNSRVFILRDSLKMERNYSVKESSRYDPTHQLFGSLKAAKAHCKRLDLMDLEAVTSRVKKLETSLKEFKDCEKKLKSNISKLR